MYIENYENLANAIVLSALKDYKNAYCTYKKGLKNVGVARYEKAVYTMESVKSFLKSHWCGMLTQVDSDYLIRIVEDKVNGVHK